MVPADYRKPYDVREVIARLVDDSDFLDFKALYGPQTVCGQAEIEGEPVGIIGNNGPIDADGAGQGRAVHPALLPGRTRRSSTCRTPPATWSAREAERAGIIKHGSKMIQAVANATRAADHHADRRHRSAPATTACAAAPTIRASSSPGPATAPP